jgi:hypothetical protein
MIELCGMIWRLFLLLCFALVAIAVVKVAFTVVFAGGLLVVVKALGLW